MIAGGAATAAAVFAFFYFCYPYHLMHREQISLFLCDSGYLDSYFSRPAWLAQMCGDFLTQLFYYIGAGPAILALLTAAIWISATVDTRSFLPAPAAVCVSTLLTLWCAARELDTVSSLSGTLAILIPLLLFPALPHIRREMARYCAGLALMALSYWLAGYGVWVMAALVTAYELRTRGFLSAACYIVPAILAAYLPMQPGKWWSKPNFHLERQLAIDSEAYFNNWKKVGELTSGESHSALEVYYRNLANALEGKLADSLRLNPESAQASLFLPIVPESDYLSIGAAGEVWFRTGDMTMAEHATMLGMIFSPRSTGTRYLRRLAEINLINGDDAAAMKYLRILAKTACHRQWALERMPGRRTETAELRLAAARRNLPTTDTLRLSADPITGLRALARSNPANTLALQYLLTAHLLRKDIKSFMSDMPEGMKLPRMWQEALLIGLSATGATPREAAAYDFDDSALRGFKAYMETHRRSGGDPRALAPAFANTYWYYFHFAK